MNFLDIILIFPPLLLIQFLSHTRIKTGCF